MNQDYENSLNPGISLSDMESRFLSKYGYIPVPNTLLQSIRSINYCISKLATSCIKQHKGHIPNLTSNTTYFNATASSSQTGYEPWNAFTSNDNEWRANSTNNFWIQIKLPIPIAVHSFSLLGRVYATPMGLTKWKFQASNDGSTWTTILSSNQLIDYQSIRIFDISSEQLVLPTRYSYYRIFVDEVTPGATNPGLDRFQIFAYCTK